jgi:hypothetical protein
MREKNRSRTWAVALSLAVLGGSQREVRAESMTFLGSGSFTTIADDAFYDQDFGVSSSGSQTVTTPYFTPSTASTVWTLSSTQIDVAIDHLMSTSGGDTSYGYIYFTVDAPCSYSLSGQYAYGDSTIFNGYGTATYWVFLSGDGYHFNNYQFSSPATGGTFTLGGTGGNPGSLLLTGSPVGNLEPGTTYLLFFWASIYSPGRVMSGEGNVRLTLGPPLDDPPEPPGDDAVDSDGDGLTDVQEADLGSDPFAADTDGDGLLDGIEVATAGGSGCPDLLVADSDADSLLDGDEVSAGTSPCAADTDGDGAPDDVDPDPTVPGATTPELVEWAEEIAEDLAAIPLSLVQAPGQNAASGRLGSLVHRLENAAEAIEDGDLETALELLESVRVRVDGLPNPDDWISDSAARDALLAELEALEALLD